MKNLKIVLIVPIVLLLLISTNLIVFAKLHPYHPGDNFFGVQTLIENLQARLLTDPMKKQEFYFELVERRLEDFEQINNTVQIEPTVNALDEAITNAILNIQNLDRENASVYYHNIQPLMRRVEAVLEPLNKKVNEVHLASLVYKVSTFKSTDSSVDLISLVQDKFHAKLIVLEPVIEANYDIVVEDYRSVTDQMLTEDTQNCMDCHEEGLYMDLATECSQCHRADVYFASQIGTEVYRPAQLEEDYPYHFGGDCIDCHNTKSWVPYQFDHRNVYTCTCCHENDSPGGELQASENQIFNIGLVQSDLTPAPSDHFEGDCILCHTDTTDWSVHSYQHHLDTCEDCHNDTIQLENYSGSVLECTREFFCQDCHSYDGHSYEGYCVTCHQNVLDWSDRSVNHDLLTDCVLCHQSDRPDNHFTGSCNECHTTTNWQDVLRDHRPDADCKSCHLPDRPDNHEDKGYTAQCSTCHNTNSWSNAVFNHTLSDCSKCHQEPANHYPAECVSCHSPTSWTIVSVDHTTLLICTDCHSAPVNHYIGLCSNCHNTTSWSDVDFDHTGYTDCTHCHTSPANHYPGECTLCHNTTSWNDVNFDHTGYTNCTTCHTPPANHYPGECTMCHNTNSWTDVNFDHTGYTDCTNCHTSPTNHYPGECTLCHNTTSWYDVNFDHTGYTNCTTCHTSPDNHYPGECTLCHNTTSWNDVDFDHTGYTNCATCHNPPANHYPGECSDCHNTTSWTDVDFDHDGYENCSSCHERPPKHPGAQCSNCHTTDSWEIP